MGPPLLVCGVSSDFLAVSTDLPSHSANLVPKWAGADLLSFCAGAIEIWGVEEGM
jgi:hypothetical protein